MEEVKDAAEDLIRVIWPNYWGDLAPALRAIAAVQRRTARIQSVWDETLRRELEETEDGV